MAWYCEKGKHYPEEVITLLDDSEVGVLVYGKSGMATNRYADGTVGVSTFLQRLAEEEEEPMCPEHKEGCIWKVSRCKDCGEVLEGRYYGFKCSNCGQLYNNKLEYASESDLM